jgi:hypothetical protein
MNSAMVLDVDIPQCLLRGHVCEVLGLPFSVWRAFVEGGREADCSSMQR